MVDVFESSTFDLPTPADPSSEDQSGASSPLQVDVPPTVRGDELFSAIGSTSPTRADAGTVFFKERDFAQVSDVDIYRGERPSSPLPSPLGADEVSVASSSSSSSLNMGRRFGALATAVEAAITRWARAHSTASSSSSSSSSSSVSTTTRTHTTRRAKGRRYSSTASLHNAAHEKAFLARKKAQEEFRIVPREFTLLLPSESVPGHAPLLEKASEQAKERRTFRTISLPLILAQLDSALKKSAKSRKVQGRSSDAQATRSNKGKGKRTTTAQATHIPKIVTSSSKTSGGNMHQKSWWLDVASPSWDDLRSIGKLLHLHPLTLEDILHRDPREKLELFPGLGYYFIVFRALEDERTRERFRHFKIQNGESMMNLSSNSGDEGVVGAVNVYIVVFSEGICSFHFEDISEHTDKLRNKILQMENTFDMTSDWIAHGLMDSIVDSFFPTLIKIDKEVKELDSIILEAPSHLLISAPTSTGDVSIKPTDGASSIDSTDEKGSSEPLNASTDEKDLLSKERISFLPLSSRASESHFAAIRRFKYFVQRMLRKRRVKEDVEGVESMTSTLKMLLRIATIRREVTSLGRLLGTKGEVVAQIRKRLILASVEASNSSLGSDTRSDGEVAIYMGDIQDHIVSLQQALNHYERMLSHSHPAYLSQLRVSQSLAKGGSDKSILLLTLVSITVVSIQVVLGLFSINVGKLPSSKGSEKHPFSVFFSILGACLLIGFGVVSLVRFWHVRAKRKYSRNL